MKTLQSVIAKALIALFAIAAVACDNDDPAYINPDDLVGTWYITNVRGWEYDEDEPNGKYKFDETFNFNGQGVPVGSNSDEAQKVHFGLINYDSENGVSVIGVSSYYWYPSYQDWRNGEYGKVKLKGNQLIDGTMKVTITKLTDKEMVTYQKDADGETFVTYTRLEE